MIGRMSYVMCDRCGNPGPMADDAKEARLAGRRIGFSRIGSEDVCPECQGRRHDFPFAEPVSSGSKGERDA